MYIQINTKKPLSKAKSSLIFPSSYKQLTQNIDLDDQINDLTCRIFSLKSTEKQLLNSILLYANKHTDNHPAQTTLAQRVGCSVRTVYRILGRLQQLGIVQSIRRDTWMTNRYVLHPLFNNWVFRNKIRTIIPHAGWSDHQLDQYKDSYSESSNTAINKTCLSEYVRPLINSNLLKGKENTRNNHQVLVVRESNSNNQEFKEGSASVLKKQEICKKNKGSGMKVVHKIKGMNDAAKMRLSCYPDIIVEYACRRLLVKKPNGDAYKYFAKICEYRAQELKVRLDVIDTNTVLGYPSFTLQPDSFDDVFTKHQSSAIMPAQPSPENTYGTTDFQLKHLETTIKRYRYLLEVNPNNESLKQKLNAIEKQYSLLITAEPVSKVSVIDIANQIAVFMDKEHLDKLIKLWDEPTATAYRDRCLANLLDGEFIDDGSPAASAAKLIIDKQCIRLGIPQKYDLRNEAIIDNPFAHLQEDITLTQEYEYTTEQEGIWELVN